MQNFLSDVAAGVALAVGSWFLFRVLAPYYLAWRYRAPKLDGQWRFFDLTDSAATLAGNASIRQMGERITADVNRTTSRQGNPVSRSFKYKGKVRDGQMLLSFEEPVSNGFIAGNLVLKVSGDLKRLTGYTVYLDRDRGAVVAHGDRVPQGMKGLA